MDAVVDLNMSHGNALRLTRPLRHLMNTMSYPAKTSVLSLQGATLCNDTSPTVCRSGADAVFHIGFDDDSLPKDPDYSGSTTEAETVPQSDPFG